MPSEQSNERRWTISHDASAEDDRPQAFRVRGPEIAFGSVEVMPVAEHEAILARMSREWNEAVDQFVSIGRDK